MSQTATLANVAASATSVTLFAAEGDTDLVSRSVFNDSAAILYLKYGATASETSYTVRIPAWGYFEFPRGRGGSIYDGVVHGIWSSATGAARTTEVA